MSDTMTAGFPYWDLPLVAIFVGVIVYLWSEAPPKSRNK
jgi:hypothetical protein